MKLNSIFAAVLLVGCGSGTPGLDSVRSDLDNPSGSISDKSAVTAAAQRNSNSGSAAGIGGANPFGGGALTAANKGPQNRIGTLTPLQPLFQNLEQRAGHSLSVRGLRAEQAEIDGFLSCFADALTGAQSSQSGNSFKASYEVNFDSCPESGFSGRLSVDLSAEIVESSGKFTMEASYAYDQLCLKGDLEICQDGSMNLEGDGTIAGSSITINTIAAWSIDTIVRQNGTEHAFNNKGGLEMKLGADNTMASGTFRMVVYLTNDKGEEISYTLTLKFNESGGSFTITGKDGTLTCTVTGSTGSCTGDGSLAWTEEDWNSAFDAWGGI